MPWPIVFWACPPPHSSSSTNDNKAAKNPFTRQLLGYDNDNHNQNDEIDTSFPPDTVFYHLLPRPLEHINTTDEHLAQDNQDNQLFLHLKVPVLDLDRADWVEAGTTAVVIIATAWILWLLGSIIWRDWVDGEDGDMEEEEHDKVKKAK